MDNEKEIVLKVEDLRVSFHTYAGEVKAVRGVSFDLHKGEVLALVGESGCGKTVTSKAVLRLLKEPPAEILEGSVIDFLGEDVTKMSKSRLQSYKGSDVAMIFQDPMTSLNPTMTVGNQIKESLKIHRKMTNEEMDNEVLRLLKLVNISDPEKRVNQYPHQLSGGLRQRVMISIALACSPKILIADEPTTALDVTIQAQILKLLGELKEKIEMSVILITHDLGVVANFADRIQVMYAGEVMEAGTVEEIFNKPHHPYTWALLRSIPKINTESDDVHLYSLSGTPPDLIMDIPGCPFADRCDYAMQICKQVQPEETHFSDTHYCKCWLEHEQAPNVERPI